MPLVITNRFPILFFSPLWNSGRPLGNKKQPVRADWNNLGQSLPRFFLSLFFFDNGNRSRLVGSFPIYTFLLLYLSSYQPHVSLAVGILWIHPLRVTCSAGPLRVAFFRVTRGVAICSLLFPILFLCNAKRNVRYSLSLLLTPRIPSAGVRRERNLTGSKEYTTRDI